MKKLNFLLIIFLAFYVTSLDASNEDPFLLQNRLEVLKSSLLNLKIKLNILKDKLEVLKYSLQGTEEIPNVENESTGLSPAQKSMVNKALAQEWKEAGLKSEDIPAAVGLVNFYKHLMYNGNDVFATTNLEAYLASNADPKNFADYLTGAISLDNESLKNEIRKEIAKRWIRNAAVRVFNDPLRSFLEIVVNACDATLPPKESVGKFGMGFLSILQLLAFEETGGVTIEIITTYQKSQTAGDNALYRMIFDLDTKETDFSKINFKDVGIKINFKYVIGPAPKETGTIVLLKPRNSAKKFSQETIKSLERYTHYLDFYNKIKIDLNGQIINEKYVQKSKPSEKNKLIVKVILDENGLAVMDMGRGIPLYVALLKLIIPSSSTKVSTEVLQAREDMRNATVDDASVEPVAFVDFHGKKDQKSHFIITVNGVVAIDIPMQHDVKIDGQIKDLLVKLPQSAQLTLARDELVMAHSVEHEGDPDPEKRGKGAEEVFFNRIIDKTIIECLDGNIETSMLQYLCYALKDWESQTSNLYIKDRFSSYLCDKISKLLSGKIVAAPSEFMEKFDPKKLGDVPLKFFPIELSEDMAGYNYGPLEEKLKWYFTAQIDDSEDEVILQLRRAGLNQQLISGMNVFFVSSGDDGLLAQNEISKLGLKNSIFVPQDLLKDVIDKDFTSAKKYLVNKIAARFIDQDFSFQDDSDNIIVFTNATDFIRSEITDREQLLSEYYKKDPNPDYANFSTILDLEKFLPMFFSKFKFLSFKYVEDLLKSDKQYFKKVRDILVKQNLIDSQTAISDEYIDKLPERFGTQDPSGKIFKSVSVFINVILNANQNVQADVLKSINFQDVFWRIIHQILRQYFVYIDMFGYFDLATQILSEEDNGVGDEFFAKYRNFFLMMLHEKSPISSFFSDGGYFFNNSFYSFIFPKDKNLITPNILDVLLAQGTRGEMPHLPNYLQMKDYICVKNVFLYDSDSNKIYQKLSNIDDSKWRKQVEGKNLGRSDALDAFSKMIFDHIQSNPSDFPEITISRFVNFYLNMLLNFFDIRTEQQIKDPSKFIYFGNEKIWPLKKMDIKSCESFLWYTLLVIEKECSSIQPGDHCGEKFSTYERALTSYLQILEKNSTDEFIKKMRVLIQGLLDGSKRLIFVSMKGIREQEYLQVRDAVKKDLPHFAATESILEKNFDGLSLIKALIPVSGLIASVDKNVISKAPKASVDALTNFKQRIATIFENYVNIPESQMPFVYGEVAKISAKNCPPESDTGDCRDLLEGLMQDKNQHLFKRVLDLTFDDLKEKTSQKYQESDLAIKQLFVPSILFNSPMAVTAKLFSLLKRFGENYALNVVKELIESSSNEKELLFAANLLLQDINLKVFQEKDAGKQADLVKALKFICKKFIPEKIDKESILDSYEQCRKFTFPSDKVGYFSKKPECRIINEYLTSVLDPGEIATTSLVLNNEFFKVMPKIPEIKKLRTQAIALKIPEQAIFDAKSIQEFSLKQLINAHVSGRGVVDMLIEDSLDEAKDVIRAAPRSFDLGKIAQSVEFGSEREPIHATLIECLQNSVDAIRGFIKEIQKNPLNVSLQRRTNCLGKTKAINQLGEIEYSLELMKIGVGHSLCLSIVDHIGFPSLKQILSDFMLPDYSTKSPALGNVGDMGNGTFKIYQHATKVLLLTRTTSNPDKVYLLVIKPLRSPTTGLIEDLMFDCFDVSVLIEKFNPDFFGTSFKIIFEEKDLIEARSDYLSTKGFLFECMSCVDVNLDMVDKGKLKLILNEQGKARQFNDADDKSIYIHNLDNLPIFKISQRSSKFMQSYLTTGGIPFKSLGAVLGDEKLLPSELILKLRYGYIVDLALNTYEPVQSRTKLKMKERFKQELRRALFEAYFIRGILLASDENTSEEFLNMHFTHFASEISDLGQLGLGDAANKEFQDFYDAFVQGKPIARNATEKDFFDFYRSISLTKPGPKNLYDFIAYECTDTKSFYWKIKQANDVFQLQTNAKFSSILGQLQNKYILNSDKTSVTQNEHKEISDIFQRDYTEYYSEKWEKINEQKIAEFKASIQAYQQSVRTENNSAYIPQFFENVVIPWFAKKFKNIKPKLKKLSDLENAEPRFKTAEIQAFNKKVTEKLAENIMGGYVGRGTEFDVVKDFFVTGQVKDFLNYIISEYISCFFECLGESGPKNAKFAYEENNEASGYYSASKNLICINLKYYKFSELLNFAVTLFRFCIGKEDSLKRVMKTKLYQDVFDEAMKGNATAVLTHELEHARRNDATCHGAHTDGYDASGMKVNFNSCARSWMQNAIDKGFKEAWYEHIKSTSATKAAEKFKEFLVADKSEDWNKFLEQFRELEKITPNIAKELGF